MRGCARVMPPATRYLMTRSVKQDSPVRRTWVGGNYRWPPATRPGANGQTSMHTGEVVERGTIVEIAKHADTPAVGAIAINVAK